MRSDAASFRAFAPDVPVIDSGGECVRLPPALNGAAIFATYYPARDGARALISVTVDSSGKMIRYAETRGVVHIAGIAPTMTRAQRDSVRRSAEAVQRTTSINLDYGADRAMLENRGGGAPDVAALGSVRLAERLPQLQHPAERAQRAVGRCGFQLGNVPLASGSPPARLTAPATATSFFDALADHDWATAAAAMDLAWAAQIRADLLANLVEWVRNGKPDPERAPGGAFALQASRGFGARDTAMIFLYDTAAIPGLARPITLGGLARLTPIALMALALETRYGADRAPRHVLGAVAEGGDDSVSHVVYRVMENGPSTTPLDPYAAEVVHLRRVGGAWKVTTTPRVLTWFDLYGRATSARTRPR